MEITSSSSSRSVSEIEEEISNDGIQVVALESINEEIELASAAADDDDNNDNVYYVVILGKSNEEESSMDALVWTLNNVIPMPMDHPSSLVYLIHVFPELHFIPTPCTYVRLSLLIKHLSLSHTHARTHWIYILF